MVIIQEANEQTSYLLSFFFLQLIYYVMKPFSQHFQSNQEDIDSADLSSICSRQCVSGLQWQLHDKPS